MIQGLIKELNEEYVTEFKELKIIYNGVSDSILNSSNNLAEIEKRHNDTYLIYTGQKSGFLVNDLINTALTNNLSEPDNNKKVRIFLDGNGIIEINNTQGQICDITKHIKLKLFMMIIQVL